jgi:hypothetical protein
MHGLGEDFQGPLQIKMMLSHLVFEHHLHHPEIQVKLPPSAVVV